MIRLLSISSIELVRKDISRLTINQDLLKWVVGYHLWWVNPWDLLEHLSLISVNNRSHRMWNPSNLKLPNGLLLNGEATLWTIWNKSLKSVRLGALLHGLLIWNLGSRRVVYGGKLDLNGVPNYGGITGTKLLLNGSWLHLWNGVSLNGDQYGLLSSLQVILWTSLSLGRQLFLTHHSVHGYYLLLIGQSRCGEASLSIGMLGWWRCQYHGLLPNGWSFWMYLI